MSTTTNSVLTTCNDKLGGGEDTCRIVRKQFFHSHGPQNTAVAAGGHFFSLADNLSIDGSETTNKIKEMDATTLPNGGASATTVKSLAGK
jgi:hypothetical protein